MLTRHFIVAGLLLAVAGAEADVVYRNAADYPSINAAVISCGNADQCIVTVPAGTYNQINTVPLKSGVQVIGQGNVTLDVSAVVGHTAFKAVGTAVQITTVSALQADPYQIKLASNNGVHVGDMLRFGAGLDVHVNEVASILSNGNILLRYRVPFFVANADPVAKVTPVDAVTIKNIKITNSSNPYYFALMRDVNIESVGITYNALYPVLSQVLRGRIMSCTADASGGGFYAQSSTDVTIANCTVTDQQKAGFFVRSCSKVQLNNNLCHSSHVYSVPATCGDGFTVVKSQWVDLVKNTGMSNSCYGMWIDNSRDCSVVQNIIDDSFTNGYYFTNGQNFVIQQNIAQNIDNAHGFGIQGGGNHVMTNNSATNVIYGYIVYQSSNDIIGKNIATNCVTPEFIYQASGLIRR